MFRFISKDDWIHAPALPSMNNACPPEYTFHFCPNETYGCCCNNHLGVDKARLRFYNLGQGYVCDEA